MSSPTNQIPIIRQAIEPPNVFFFFCLGRTHLDMLKRIQSPLRWDIHTTLIVEWAVAWTDGRDGNRYIRERERESERGKRVVYGQSQMRHSKHLFITAAAAVSFAVRLCIASIKKLLFLFLFICIVFLLHPGDKFIYLSLSV